MEELRCWECREVECIVLALQNTLSANHSYTRNTTRKISIQKQPFTVRLFKVHGPQGVSSHPVTHELIYHTCPTARHKFQFQFTSVTLDMCLTQNDFKILVLNISCLFYIYQHHSAAVKIFNAPRA